jgi:glucosamine--fructose-6-phosphate aminotransferase (isomerizing)
MDVLLDGLRRLEYRGYDSAGVAICEDGEIEIRRALGKLVNLEGILRDKPIPGRVGIGHTRWATHGKPSERNAHPHRSGSVAIVHNGIIENYRELRHEIESAGRSISSETDTELIAHLIDLGLEAGDDLSTAVRAVCARLDGSYAFGALCCGSPDHMVAAKNGGSPIILGVGEKQSFLASDIPAILPYTRQMMFLEDGEFAVLSEDGVQVIDAEGRPVDREPRPIQWDPVSAEKGGYDRFMQKEIFEQPRAIMDTIGTRALESQGDVELNGIDLSPERVAAIRRIYLVACGTACYASMVGKYLLEQIAGIPAEVDLASEFRYRKPILDDSSLVLPVSQSGETADTLAALREGKSFGSRVLSICNVRDATIARESDDVLYTHAGPEIGVASTKAFTTQIVALYLLALKLGISRGRVSADEARRRLLDLMRLPRLVERTLQLDDSIRAIARKFFHASDFLFLGRGIMYPIALEGALKLKEISYIHAEGYAAGEMKHGPIALIDEDMPVVVIANQSPVYDKVVSNLEQVPVLATVPLQLLAYHIAVLKGTDVDQPRNLAKSVTVE